MQTQLEFLLELFIHLPYLVCVLWADAQVLAFRMQFSAVRKCYHILFLIVSVGLISY